MIDVVFFRVSRSTRYGDGTPNRNNTKG